MPVNKGQDGRRWVEAEVEVPGTPDQVWQAIATGPGVTSWFVPAQVEERVGGAVISNFGPGMESHATVTAWDPPHRFTAESRDLGPNGPTIATEWSVEAKSGDTCVVRVVHAWFADSDDWDGQFEAFTEGWPAFFRILRLYLARYRGQAGTNIQVLGVGQGGQAAAWAAFAGRLGLVGAKPGQRVEPAADAPALAGQVVHAADTEQSKELLLQLDAPAQGIGHLFASKPIGGQIYLSVRLYLFDGAAAAGQEEAAWRAWLGRHFPMPGQPG